MSISKTMFIVLLVVLSNLFLLNDLDADEFCLSLKSITSEVVHSDATTTITDDLNRNNTHQRSDVFPVWWVPTKKFKPVKSGEHPRLLFRKSDIPALRKKAQTPEGQAMIQQLRYLLDGENGQNMPSIFNPATHAYYLGEWHTLVKEGAGVYTFGHLVGYGLLYQLTDDKRYAELCKQCFELALEGQRDRDDRYSWVNPGGALRAGPVLGWSAIGYDLCYDGWDEDTRERFGRAIASFDVGRESGDARAHITLEALAGGTMPPFSNHFGMQVGGAALALMAVSGEPWVDQKEIDRLLKISEESMIRNVREGFGDGGFFAEGDGTGSMASHIVYLTAIQAWKNAMGKDFINTNRPNVRMTALKWFYLTIFREGEPDFWPGRGGYPHNIWDRTLSGAGYVGIGLGAVTLEEKKAIKWFYNHFMLEDDTKMGRLYEQSPYPHIMATTFVNWPSDLREKNPSEVLPLCYQDSIFGFYAWRNRWQDENDIVITVLTKPSRGYMRAKADTTLYIKAFGERFTWGTLAEEAISWNRSKSGETSHLILNDGTSIAVDFTRSSGADAMLVTTGKAEGETVRIDEVDVTFTFLTQTEKPNIELKGGKVFIGDQIVWLQNGNIQFEISSY